MPLSQQPQQPVGPAPVVTGGVMISGGIALTGSASLAAQAALVTRFYASQSFLAASSIRDVLAIWSQLNFQDVRSSWPALRTALSSLIRDRFRQSVAEGADYYRQARQAAEVPGEAHIIEPELPSADLIDGTLDSTGPWGMLGKIKQGQQVTQAADNSGVRLAGASSRLIQNGARQVVLHSVDGDAEAVGWMRVTQGNPCAWCSMLASRGVSYKTKASAGFEAHEHCNCKPMAVFSRSAAKASHDNPLYQQWQQVTKGYGGRDALNAWRRYWDAQQNRDGVIVRPAA